MSDTHLNAYSVSTNIPNLQDSRLLVTMLYAKYIYFCVNFKICQACHHHVVQNRNLNDILLC